MVKIIKGTLGYYTRKGMRMITEKDGPVQLESELEARLVSEGVAVYVGDKKPTQANVGPETANVGLMPPEEEPVQEAESEIDYNSMTYAELKALASDLGLDIKSARSKKALIEFLESEDGSDEAPPEFTATGLV